MPLFSLEGREQQLKKQKEQKFRELEKDFRKRDSDIYSPDFLNILKAGWLVERGAYLADNENMELGGHDFKEALEIDPDNISVRQVMAMFYRQSGDSEAALEIIKTTKKSILKDVSISIIAFLKEAGLIYYSIGDTKKSIATLKLAIKQATTNKKEIEKSAEFAVKAGVNLEGEINVDAEIEEIKNLIKEIKSEKTEKKETTLVHESDELIDWDSEILQDWDNIK